MYDRYYMVEARDHWCPKRPRASGETQRILRGFSSLVLIRQNNKHRMPPQHKLTSSVVVVSHTKTMRPSLTNLLIIKCGDVGSLHLGRRRSFLLQLRVIIRRR